jgi:nickel/cobalt transporter (NiCoT) family protein
VLVMGTVIAVLHAVGFFLLIAVVAPHHHRLAGAGAFTVGLGMTAHTLGLRHASTPTTSPRSTTPRAS